MGGSECNRRKDERMTKLDRVIESIAIGIIVVGCLFVAIAVNVANIAHIGWP